MYEFRFNNVQFFNKLKNPGLIFSEFLKKFRRKTCPIFKIANPRLFFARSLYCTNLPYIMMIVKRELLAFHKNETILS